MRGSRTALTIAFAFALLVAAVGCSDDEALRLSQAEVAKGNETISGLNAQVAERDRLLAEANAEIALGNESAEALNAEVEQANETIESFVASEAKWSVEFDALAVDRDALAQQNTELETALADLESEHTTVDGLLAQAQADLAEVKTALAEAQAASAALRGADGRVQTLEERAAEIEARVDALLEQERSLTTEYASLRSAYEVFLKERCAIRSDLAPYHGTVHDFGYDLLGPSDPTSFQSVTYAGRGDRLIWDWRPREWITVNAYLFDASYGGGKVIEFQINPEYGTREAARAQVDIYAAALGRIPVLLMSRLDAVQVNDTDEGRMSASWTNRSINISARSAELYVNRGGLEEVFIHEGVHVSLDGAHRNTHGWSEAQMKDCVYISSYDRDNADTEDFAESFSAYFALRYLADRLTNSDKAAILNNIPHRIAYFDEQGFDLSIPQD